MPDGFASWGKEVVEQSLYSVPPPGMTHARVCGACEALSPAGLTVELDQCPSQFKFLHMETTLVSWRLVLLTPGSSTQWAGEGNGDWGDGERAGEAVTKEGGENGAEMVARRSAAGSAAAAAHGVAQAPSPRGGAKQVAGGRRSRVEGTAKGAALGVKWEAEGGLNFPRGEGVHGGN